MALSQNQLKHVCMINGGYRQCRYLAQDEQDYSKWYCLKKTGQAKQIDEDLDDTLESLKQRKMNYKTQGLPVGDNCNGYPLLKIIDQGYDVDQRKP